MATQEDLWAQTDGALSEWRQGDVVIGDFDFVFLSDLTVPLTPEAIALCGDSDASSHEGSSNSSDFAAVAVNIRGVVIVSQSCDVIRKCRERPFVEVSPVVEIPEGQLAHVRSGRSLQYAFVPGISDSKLVADLSRTMTVEKSAVAKWKRIHGCRTDDEKRAFARFLARKRQRFAFPDDFVELVSRLRSRIIDKHDKNSPEGKMLGSLLEIRVRASWEEQQRAVMLYFIKSDGADSAISPDAWAKQLEHWLELIPHSEIYNPIEGQIATLDDLTGRDYVESDPLDLDHLSTGA